jgi:hypothetical protein
MNQLLSDNRTQQRYIKSFYIEFGFKSWENVETKFKEAILRLTDLVDEEMKDFIVEE